MDTNSISLKPLPHQSMDFQFLREEGLRHIQRLSGNRWTDHNEHDPGITMLEQLCYAITDLGYRIAHPTADLLHTPDGQNPYLNLYQPEQLLPTQPINLDDYRKLLIDLPLVKNVAITPLKKDKITQAPVVLGKYQVVVEPELNTTPQEVIGPVFDQLMANRNLCEDFTLEDITISVPEAIVVEAKLEVEDGTDANLLLAQVYHQLSLFIAPRLGFYSREQMLDKGYTLDEVMNGPRLKHGFIDTVELRQFQKKTQLRTSDLIQVMMDVPGVSTVMSANIWSLDPADTEIANNSASGGFIVKSGEWGIALDDDKFPQLKVAFLQKPPIAEDQSRKYAFFETEDLVPATSIPSSQRALSIRLSRKSANAIDDPNLDDTEEIEQIPEITTDPEIVWREFNRLQRAAYEQASVPVETFNQVPTGGRYRNVENYYSFQNHFPQLYGIGEAGLPESESPKRKAQAKQLKAYLSFFDNLLANYFSQLANFSKLFSFQDITKTTYFFQSSLNVPGIEDVRTSANPTETGEDAERRNLFLDHLLARFGESMVDYSLLLFSQQGNMDAAADQLMAAKQSFLSDYVAISHQRSTAYHYGKPHENTTNISGLERRLCRLFGVNADLQGDAFTKKRSADPDAPQAFYLIEHILLHKDLDFSGNTEGEVIHNHILFASAEDPDDYSLGITFVFPDYGGYFADRNLVQRVIRQEAPAHLRVQVQWIETRDAWINFETAYFAWTRALQQDWENNLS